jgi:hypothetical protein
MRKAAVALSLVVLGVASAFGAQQAPADWLKYSSPEGRYNVLFPAQPKLSAQDGTGATGEKFKQYIASANDDLSVYMIGYFDYTPPMTFSFDDTLVSESAISLGGRPGRELKVAAKTADGLDFIVRARYYDAGGRVYLIQIVTRKTTEAAAYSDKATRFFDSFQVVTTP